MKKNENKIGTVLHLTLLTTLALLMYFGCRSAHAQQTNLPPIDPGSLNFTNVNIEAWTGYQYEGNSGDSTAILGASIDLGDFAAGKFGRLNYGLGTELSIGATGSAVHGLSLRAELMKNSGPVQIVTFVGVGRDFNQSSYYGEFGCGLNYNLYRTSGGSFAYIGTGINFRFNNSQSLDYLPCVRTGIAF